VTEGTRERPDISEALDEITEYHNQDAHKNPVLQRLLDFKVFATALLIALVVITLISLGLAVYYNAQLTEDSAERTERFESHVEDILEEISDGQDTRTEELRRVADQLEGAAEDIRRAAENLNS